MIEVYVFIFYEIIYSISILFWLLNYVHRVEDAGKAIAFVTQYDERKRAIKSSGFQFTARLELRDIEDERKQNVEKRTDWKKKLMRILTKAFDVRKK